MTKRQVNRDAFARTVGIDIGYGDLKASNSQVTMRIPSIIGAAPTMRYSDEWSKNDGDVVTDDQGAWYVGEKALMHSKNVRYIKDRGRTLLPDYRRLLYVALGQLHPVQDDANVVPVNVVTGLPVAHMGDKDSLVTTLKGQHRVKTLHTNGVYSIENVAVAPQPYGTLFYNVLNDYGDLVSDELSNARVFIVDCGRFTTNFVMVDRMAYLERGSDSIDSGVYLIENHFYKYFEQKYNWTEVRPDFVLDIILSPDHTCKIDNERLDLTDVFNEGATDLSEHVIGKMGELIGSARDIDYILLTGGGNINLEPWIQQRYRRASLTENPVMANAIGFARYGRRQWA